MPTRKTASKANRCARNTAWRNRLRLSFTPYSLSVVPDPGVKPGINNFRSQVSQEYHQRANQGDGDDHRVIVGKDSIKRNPAQPGNTEDNLGEVSPPEDYPAQIEHDNRDHRQDSVAQDMLADDQPFRQSLGAGRLHEVHP